MSKSHVVTAQTALKEAGLYTGIIDGDFGGGSLRAVQQLLTNAVKAVEILDKSVADKPPQPANYILSEQSLQKLKGVHPDLVKVVKRAIQITKMDFAVNEGLRTVEQQRKYVNAGKSQTMKSNHITGRAVDIVPTPGGGPMNWNDWTNYYIMVEAMQKAAEELNVTVRWGGCWEVINGKAGSPKSWVDAYGARKRAAGQKAFTDGPHFELG